MNIIKHFLFLFGCILSRLLITYIASIEKYTKILGLLALIPSFGFMYIYVFGLRKIGSETFGELIWWNHLRPIHSINLLLFSIMTMFNYTRENAWIILFLDTLLGYMSWILH